MGRGDDRRLTCLAITPDSWVTFWSYIVKNKLLLLKCHDVYVIKTRQRCRSFVLNEFNLILDGMGIEVHDGVPKKNISEGTLQVMNSISLALWVKLPRNRGVVPKTCRV